jgi:hypothetical protein
MLRKVLNIFFMIVGLSIIIGCSTQPEQSVKSPKTSTPVPLPTSTSTPAPLPTSTSTSVPLPTSTPEPITFDNVCGQYGDEITLEGIMHLPDEISCTTGGSPNWCTVQLLDVDRNGYIVMGLNIEYGEYDPVENYMSDLPMAYEISDFKARSEDGKLIGEGDLVRITGEVTSPLLGTASGQEINCSLENVRKIERVSRITIQGPEELTQANLLEAITNGWVIASISGHGLSNIDISLKPQIDFNLELSIEPGTVFEAQSGGVQNMVLRQGTVVVLKPNIEISLELEVSCANMELDEPSGTDTFTVREGKSDDLLKLLNLSEFRFGSGRVQQFAIWTITDNPSRNSFTGIADQYGIGSGPTDDEIERIRELFRIAGINISKYNVFNF